MAINDRRLDQLPPTENVFPADLFHVSQGGIDKRINAVALAESISGGNPFKLSIVEVTSTSRTLTTNDVLSYMRFLNSDPSTITVPTVQDAGWTLGDNIIFRKEGAGTVEVVTASGVTINGLPDDLVLTENGQQAQLIYVRPNEWDFIAGFGTEPSEVGGSLGGLSTPSQSSYIRTNPDGSAENRNFVQVKEDLSLGNVDNTSDLDKPISTATQSALDDKYTSGDAITWDADIVGDVSISGNLSVGGAVTAPQLNSTGGVNTQSISVDGGGVTGAALVEATVIRGLGLGEFASLEVNGNIIVSAQNNLGATSPPTASNNASEGYDILSKWVDTSEGEIYILTGFDGTDAVWKNNTLEVGDLSNLAVTNATPAGLALVQQATPGSDAYIRLNSDGTTTNRTASQVRDDIGATANQNIVAGSGLLGGGSGDTVNLSVDTVTSRFDTDFTKVAISGMGDLLNNELTRDALYADGTDNNNRTRFALTVGVSQANRPVWGGADAFLNGILTLPITTSRGAQLWFSPAQGTNRFSMRTYTGGTFASWVDLLTTGSFSANVNTMLVSANNAAIRQNIGVNVSVPSSATATGVAGQFAYDADFFYVCTATNTWVRTALTTW